MNEFLKEAFVPPQPDARDEMFRAAQPGTKTDPITSALSPGAKTQDTNPVEVQEKIRKTEALAPLG